MEEPIKEYALQIIDTGEKDEGEYKNCDRDVNAHHVLSTYNPYDNKFSIVLYDKYNIYVVHSEVTPLKLNYLKPFLENTSNRFNPTETYGTIRDHRYDLNEYRSPEDGQHIVNIERKLGYGVHIGSEYAKRCIISIAQGSDDNIYLAMYSREDGAMEYFHYNMNNPGLANLFSLRSRFGSDIYSKWVNTMGITYFKIICSSDGSKLVVFKELDFDYIVSVFSTDNFEPICEVKMDDERGRNGGRNDEYIRDVKFACNDSYLLIIDSDSYLYSVNISTSEWSKIKHGSQYSFSDSLLHSAAGNANSKVQNTYEIADIKDHLRNSIHVHCTNNNDNICYYILTVKNTHETFVVELYYDGNILHNVSRIFTYSMNYYLIMSACMSLNNEIYFLCAELETTNKNFRCVDHEANKNKIKNDENGLDDLAEYYVQNIEDAFNDFGNAWYRDDRLMHEPIDTSIPANYRNIELKETMTGSDHFSFLQILKTNVYDMHHKSVIETDQLGNENEEQYIIINTMHTIQDKFNQPRLIIFKLSNYLKPSSVMNWYDPEAAGFAPVNRNTNRLGDPFVRGQFEQQMKERSNYTKKKVLESPRFPTRWDKAAAEAAEAGMVKSNIHNLIPDIEKSGDKVYNDTIAFNKEWKSTPSFIVPARAAKEATIKATNNPVPSSEAIDMNLLPRRILRKSESDLSLERPYSHNIQLFNPKEYDNELLEEQIKSTRDPQVLENIEKFSEENRIHELNTALNPIIGYTDRDAINVISTRVQNLENDMIDVKSNTSEILNILKNDNKLGGKKRKTRRNKLGKRKTIKNKKRKQKTKSKKNKKVRKTSKK